MVAAGPQAGRRFVLQPPALIGRDEAAALILPDPLLSRRHAELSWDPDSGKFRLKDLGSRNGTFVKGARVQHASLEDGDRLGIGNHVLIFTQVDPAEHELRRRQRLEMLGRLAVGVAHDLNNMLGAILTTLEFIRRLDDREIRQIRECVEEATGAASRAAALTPRLLAFARSDSPGFAPCDLSRTCGELARLARRTFPRAIRVEVDVAPGLFVSGDEVELFQALMNLLLNARDAMPMGGVIRLEAARCELPARPGPHVAVAVADTGFGMNAATRARLFEPFFSTKGAAGTGLGLATAREIAESHGGVLSVESAPGAGTRISFALPLLSPESAVPRARTTQVPPPDLAGRTVLVADDEPSVLQSIRRILSARGVSVIEATDGAEAIDAFQNGTVRPDVVLLDVGMQNVDGIEALRRLRRLDRAVRVVLMTGHCEDAAERELRSRGACGVLAKPYSIDALVQALSQALHGSAPPDDPSTGHEPSDDGDTGV